MNFEFTDFLLFFLCKFGGQDEISHTLESYGIFLSEVSINNCKHVFILFILDVFSLLALDISFRNWMPQKQNMKLTEMKHIMQLDLPKQY